MARRSRSKGFAGNKINRMRQPTVRDRIHQPFVRARSTAASAAPSAGGQIPEPLPPLPPTTGAPYIDPITQHTAPGAQLTYKLQLYDDPAGINNPVAKWYIDGVLSYTGPEYTVQWPGVISCTVSYTTDSGRQVNDVACSNTVESLVGLEHDFTDGVVEPFIHTRASHATGINELGVIVTYQDDEPVFIGAPS